MIGEHAGNIDNVIFSKQSPDFREMIVDIEVHDVRHLTTIIAALRALPLIN